jgi:predicted transcriptional regulator
MNTVVLEVRPLTETLADAAQVMNTGHAEHAAHIGFATPELLWQVLTSKRWQLLKAMCGAGPIAMREAARCVGRDVKAVHSDMTALLKAGLVDRTADSCVEFPFETIKVEFKLHAAPIVSAAQPGKPMPLTARGSR